MMNKAVTACRSVSSKYHQTRMRRPIITSPYQLRAAVTSITRNEPQR